MADKQATVYIVDQGQSMGECHNGRVESDLDFGMRYIWDAIATTMSAGKASWSVGVVGVRTDETNNPLEEDEGYQHISIMKHLGPMEMSHLRELQTRIRPSHTEDGDAISAIVVGVERIAEFTTLKTGKMGKYARKLVLVTNGLGTMDGEDIESIAERINECEIELVVIGIDFDDEEFGFVEEDKPALKRENEELLKKLVQACNKGIFGTAAEAIAETSVPRVKATRPYAPYKGRLQLGDIEKYPETALYIDVERYFRTKAAKPPSASSFVTRSSIANGEASAQSSNTLPGDTEMPDVGGDLSAVKMTRNYQVNDPGSYSGKKDVDRDDLAKGFEYGRTAVHISESDENVTKIETFQSFTIIGFIPSDKYEKYLTMGESCITIAQPVNDKAVIAMSSLVHALHELESYAVARIVTKDGKDSQILLLAPSIEPEMEALIDVPLPFAEDVRVYSFPPLDRVITASGAHLTKHRYLPSDELSGAMSDYVDSMDLSTFGKDGDDQPAEYMQIDDTYSPSVHRINQAIRQRAVHPSDPIAPPAAVLMKWSNPPQELVSASASQLQKLVGAAEVKKVSPKAKGKRGHRETVKPLSGLDVDSLLDREERQKISPDNAIPEFKQMVNTTRGGDEDIANAMAQMSKITRDLISTTVGDNNYEMALQNMAVMREEMIGLEVPEVYNEFFQDLKRRIVEKDGLGGDRRDFWFQTKPRKLGLIHNKVSEVSDISEEEANEFYSLKTGLPTRVKKE